MEKKLWQAIEARNSVVTLAYARTSVRTDSGGGAGESQGNLTGGGECYLFLSRGNKYSFASIFVSLPEGAQRCSDYCPIRENYEQTQKNESECFKAINMAHLARRKLQTIRLPPDIIWQYLRAA